MKKEFVNLGNKDQRATNRQNTVLDIYIGIESETAAFSR